MRLFRVEQALKKLGSNIQHARKRRRISTSLMAERIGITRATLSRLEAGQGYSTDRAIIALPGSS
ncbi:helix-turn-helix transcriptional regulator [Sodalis ligni]|uniref:helix-turn-helix domain-containing protein n=1 Tax=Sodalis ligni TaxID=2697027 RepID=UPI00193F7363|nr:helix-turn-helix transcriptional regulator [Sodalis ligni]QWA11515.1 helix-turn-helix transcriptional regulator [Sodalis ligni]